MLIYGHYFSDTSTSMASAAAALAARLELPLLLVHVHESHPTLDAEAEARMRGRGRASPERGAGRPRPPLARLPRTCPPAPRSSRLRARRVGGPGACRAAGRRIRRTPRTAVEDA